jgi:CHASE2 domain-containing sensor protein
MIIIAGIINIFMTWKRNMREYALVGVWALIAVALANRDNGTAIFIVGMATAAIIASSCLIHGIKNFRGFGEEI